MRFLIASLLTQYQLIKKLIMLNYRKNQLDYRRKGSKKRMLSLIVCTILLTFQPIFAFTQPSKNISLSVKNATLQQLFNEIEGQSAYRFSYRDVVLENKQDVTISVSNQPVESVLNRILPSRNLQYRVTGHSIQIIPAPEQTGTPRKITGVVSDENGEPVIGANVVEKGTVNGAVTDADGNFSLNIQSGAVLKISYVGYMDQEIAVGEKTALSVRLQENLQLLDEVVVVGYGTMQRKNFTGSVSTVNVANSPIALSPRTNAMDALRGTVTGTTVSRETDAGSSPSIQIHGQKSVTGSSTPLIVLDGVIFMGGWRDIEPSTVESINVLKDATSLAAYGSQAANGVIMITTKKGKLGKPVISFESSLAVSSKTMMPKLLSAEDFVRKSNFTKGVTDGNPQSWMKPSSYENYQAGRTTDWLDYATQTGYTQRYAVSVSGATEKINYYTSLSHSDQKGIVIGDRYSREAMTIQLQHDITNWLQAGAQVNYSYNNYDGVSAELKPFLSPYNQPVRPNGELEKFVTEEGSFGWNPLWNTEKGGTVDDCERYAMTLLRGHLLVKAPWITGLSYRLNVMYSEENYKHDRFTHEGNYVTEGYYKNDERYAPETLAGYLSNANGYNQRRLVNYYVIDNILNYVTQWNRHFIDLTAVYTRDQNTSDTRQLNGSNFEAVGNTLLGYDGLAFATTQTVGISKIRKANIGYLGRLNYNYDDRYHLTASVRRDGSSVFGANHKWGVFPAAGVAWTASRENFMKSITAINYLKVKASWGKNGNQSLSPYGTLSTINLGQTGNHPYLFGNTGSPSWGQYVSAIGNADLGWETTLSFNAGFDIGLLNDRIHLEFDTYQSQTTDQIFNRAIPSMGNGFSSTKATMGRVDNHGVEFTLNTINIKQSDLEWSSMLNFYLNRNKLVELYGDGKDDIGSSLFLGKSLGAIYGYKLIGIVQIEDTEYIAANTTQPGYPKYANLDGSTDGKITPEDRTILGYNKENFRMNMSHTLTYKNWQLYALFSGTFSGGDYGVETNVEAFKTNEDVYNNIDHVWWTPENRSNVYPTATFNGANYTPVMSYGFVRLQDLNLSYTFRQQALKDIGIYHLQAYISGKNLFTITDWVGGDPENRMKFGGIGNLNSYPLQRTFSFGLSLSF
jgi:TonB-linked SusC/RagA family outer membrane protein